VDVVVLQAGARSQTPRDISMISPRDCKSLRNITASSMSVRLTKLRLQFYTSITFLFATVTINYYLIQSGNDGTKMRTYLWL